MENYLAAIHERRDEESPISDENFHMKNKNHVVSSRLEQKKNNNNNCGMSIVGNLNCIM